MRKTSLEWVYKLAELDEKVVFIGSDLGKGTLQKFQEIYPERFFMEGIGEQQVVSMAAGLSLNGLKPYICTIANFFTRRAYEQIAIDVALNKAPVTFIAFGGGMVYAPLGPTHTAIDDIALMSTIPGMHVAAPADSLEMEHVMKYSLNFQSPLYIRVAKGGEPVVTNTLPELKSLSVRIIKPINKITIVTTGITLQIAMESLEAIDNSLLSKIGLVHAPFPINIPDMEVKDILSSSDIIITVEEHTKIGGLGSFFERKAFEHKLNNLEIIKLGLPNHYSSNYGTQLEHLKVNGISSENIRNILNQKKELL